MKNFLLGLSLGVNALLGLALIGVIDENSKLQVEMANLKSSKTLYLIDKKISDIANEIMKKES